MTLRGVMRALIERWPTHTLGGRKDLHLSEDTLRQGLADLGKPPEVGRIQMIVLRTADGRKQVEQARLDPTLGVVGDRWVEGRRNRAQQVTLMRMDVAQVVANGQNPALFGDNLLVSWDISMRTMPVGTQVQVGTARCRVTEKPHRPCRKITVRFGRAASRVLGDEGAMAVRLRGVYLVVEQAGNAQVGDALSVITPDCG